MVNERLIAEMKVGCKDNTSYFCRNNYMTHFSDDHAQSSSLMTFCQLVTMLQDVNSRNLFQTRLMWLIIDSNSKDSHFRHFGILETCLRANAFS